MAISQNIDIDNLRNGKSIIAKNMVGETYGYLTVMRFVGTHVLENKNVLHIMEAICRCGNVGLYGHVTLKRGDTKSCGCYQIEWTKEQHTTHGHSIKRNKSRAYNSWLAMKSRCYDKNHKHYKFYGGSGIRVCDRWKDCFENFLEDMGEPPIGHTLDRFPNMEGNYEPSNCRWATREQQANNTKRNRFIYINDEYLSLSQASRKYKFSITKARRIYRDQNPHLNFKYQYV